MRKTQQQHKVSLLNNSRSKLSAFILNRNIKQNKRQIHYNNLHTAKSFGLLIEVNNPNYIKEISSFIKDIQKKQANVYPLYFVDFKKVTEELSKHQDIKIISKKDFNWLFAPKNSEIIEFCDKPFDLLINFSLQNNKYLEQISGLSKAKCKIGEGSENSFLYDFTINMKDERTLTKYIEHLNYYLSIIRTK